MKNRLERNIIAKTLCQTVFSSASSSLILSRNGVMA